MVHLYLCFPLFFALIVTSDSLPSSGLRCCCGCTSESKCPKVPQYCPDPQEACKGEWNEVSCKELPILLEMNITDGLSDNSTRLIDVDRILSSPTAVKITGDRGEIHRAEVFANTKELEKLDGRGVRAKFEKIIRSLWNSESVRRRRRRSTNQNQHDDNAESTKKQNDTKNFRKTLRIEEPMIDENVDGDVGVESNFPNKSTSAEDKDLLDVDDLILIFKQLLGEVGDGDLRLVSTEVQKAITGNSVLTESNFATIRTLISDLEKTRKNEFQKPFSTTIDYAASEAEAHAEADDIDDDVDKDADKDVDSEDDITTTKAADDANYADDKDDAHSDETVENEVHKIDTEINSLLPEESMGGIQSGPTFRLLRAKRQGTISTDTDRSDIVPQVDKASHNCNDLELKEIIQKKIADDSRTSKRAIQSAAEERFNGTFSVICSPCEFSFVVTSHKYCEAHKGEIACFAYMVSLTKMTESSEEE